MTDAADHAPAPSDPAPVAEAEPAGATSDTSATLAERSSRAQLSAALVAGWVTVAAFIPAIRANLLQWDDVANLVDNKAYQGFSLATLKWAFTTTHLGPYQPLSWLSYTLDHAIWGGDPRGFYITNVVLQAVCASLLALLAWRLMPLGVPGLAERPGLRGTLASLAALLWSVHPQRVESVAWATERRDVLSGAFLLASALAWSRFAGNAAQETTGAEPSARWWRNRAWWAAFLLFVASLLSKATAMGFVLVLLLLDWYPFRRNPLRHVAEKVPFALAGAAAAVVAWIGQSAAGAAVDTGAVPLLGRAVIAGYATVHYLGATVWPDGLRAHYQRPETEELGRIDLLAGLVGAIVLLNLVAFLRNRMRGAAAALGAYLVLLAPVSGLSTTGSHLVADRYSHQPTMGLGIVAAAGLGALLLSPARRSVGRVLLVVACGAVVLLASHTVRLTVTWRSAKDLWWRVLDFEPRNWVAHEQLAVIAYRLRDTESAAQHLEISLASKPDRLIGTVFLANCLLETGRVEDAEKRIDHLLTHVPDHAPAWRVRGRIRAVRSDVDGAAAALEQAVRLSPDYVEAIQDLADLLSKNRSAEAAEPWGRRLVALKPRDVAALSFLGTMRLQQGDRTEAERLFREAAALDPSAALPRMCLADFYGTANQLVEAERELREVVRLDPAHAEGLGKLAIVLGIRGADDEAAEFAVRAADAVPASAEARLAAAEFLVKAKRLTDAKAAAVKAVLLADEAKDAITARRARDLLSRL